MKLKTLKGTLKRWKDIHLGRSKFNEATISYQEWKELQKDLKQEAIKWIKDFREQFSKDGGFIDYTKNKEGSSMEPNSICFWIKHFFNIKEEDLNDNNNS